jgi:hypothetical protein
VTADRRDRADRPPGLLRRHTVHLPSPPCAVSYAAMSRRRSECCVTTWPSRGRSTRRRNEAHLSRSQLVQAFDAVTSLGTMAYLRLMRAQQTARLLTHSDLPISAISWDVGWTDANYASRCFHANNGISPAEYRRQHAALWSGRGCR